jgi:hypothetical protein
MRLRILELPPTGDPERPDSPFVLFFDQATDDERAELEHTPTRDLLRDRIGARAVVVFRSSVDIPAAGG